MASPNPPSTLRSKGPLIITVLVVVLLVLHQDNWLWTNDTLVFGFMPISLFYHACISIAASATWFLATRIAWPIEESTESSVATNLNDGEGA